MARRITSASSVLPRTATPCPPATALRCPPPDPDSGASGAADDVSTASDADAGGAVGERLRLARRRLETVLSPGGGTGASSPPARRPQPAPSEHKPTVRTRRVMLTRAEIEALGEYRQMTEEELAAAPEYQEMPPAMAKRLVPPSALLRYEQALKQEAKEEEDYQEACRVLFLRVLAVLPQSAVDIIKARQDWASMDAAKDVIALRNAVIAAVTNADTRLYTPLQACRSMKDVLCLRQRKGETVHAYYDRCEQTFYAHQEAGHGWPVESHYQEVVKRLRTHPGHDRAAWTAGSTSLRATRRRRCTSTVSTLSRPWPSSAGFPTCFICKEVGHKANECPNKDAVAAGTFRPGAAATTNTTTTAGGAAPAPPPPAPSPAPAAAPSAGVPLSLTLSAPPPANGSGAASAVSAFTNTTRGVAGGSRTISNQELVELLRSTQDNGDGTSTLLFATIAVGDPDGSAPADDTGGTALAAVPPEN